MLEQRGDHACSECNDQVCLFGGQWRGMTVAEMVAETRPFKVYIVFSFFSSSFSLRLCGDGKSMLPGV